MAQTTAEEVKNEAIKKAEMIVNEAQTAAKDELLKIDSNMQLKQKELEDLQKQFDVYKAKMESMLISQLELLKGTGQNNLNNNATNGNVLEWN